MKNIYSINEYNANKLYTHYNDIDRKAFDIITKQPKRTIYIQWLLDLYRNKKLKLEDIDKADKYISIFNKPNVLKKLGGMLSIKNVDSIQSLYKLIEPYYINKELDVMDEDDYIMKKCLVKKFKNYNLYVPRDHDDAVYLGQGTEWCTSVDSANSLNTYNTYVKDGELYILICTLEEGSYMSDDFKPKYQIHFESCQFMDEDDQDVRVDEEFYLNNKDIVEYFIKLKGAKCLMVFNIDNVINYFPDECFIMYSYEHVMGGMSNNFKDLPRDEKESYDYIIKFLQTNDLICEDEDLGFKLSECGIDDIKKHMGTIYLEGIDYGQLVIKHKDKLYQSTDDMYNYVEKDDRKYKHLWLSELMKYLFG